MARTCSSVQIHEDFEDIRHAVGLIGPLPDEKRMNDNRSGLIGGSQTVEARGWPQVAKNGA